VHTDLSLEEIMEYGKAAVCHGQVADFQPQILLKIKQNVSKTLAQ
jgi:hypothetical protein